MFWKEQFPDFESLSNRQGFSLVSIQSILGNPMKLLSLHIIRADQERRRVATSGHRDRFRCHDHTHGKDMVSDTRA